VNSIGKKLKAVMLLSSLALSIGGCSQGDKPPTGWQKLETGAFSLYGPPGWELRKRQGFDSYVAELAGDGMVLSFDFGRYSNPLSDAQEPSYVIVYEVVHGVNAKIVSPKKPGQGITGIYFPSVPTAEIGNKLCLVGYDLTAAQQETALRMFQTIRFDSGRE
jgi:hypothetical protein